MNPIPLRGIVRPVVASAIFFMIVTGIAYPLFTTGVAHLLFPNQARGSLIERDGVTVGSVAIGQHFTRPAYFHGRPSETATQPYNAGMSGAGNQGVLSRKLIDAVAARTKAYREENNLPRAEPVPVDAVTASGSGLDPHISVANARLQVARVAGARGLAAKEVLSLVDRHTTGRRVNVLELNLALDAVGKEP